MQGVGTVIPDRNGPPRSADSTLAVPADPAGIGGGGRAWSLGFTVASELVIAGLWELGARTGVLNDLYTSRPSDILLEIGPTLTSAEFWENARVSGIEIGVGFGLAVVVGIPLGLILGSYRRLRWMAAPWLDAFNAVPLIALMPLLIIWFGVGTTSKVATVFVASVCLILMSSFLGAQAVSYQLLQIGTVFNASPWRRFRAIVFPSTIPHILVGLKMSVGSATVGVIFAESYGADVGIGHLMAQSARNLQTTDYFVMVTVFTVVGALGYLLVSFVERYVRTWRAPEEA